MISKGKTYSHSPTWESSCTPVSSCPGARNPYLAPVSSASALNSGEAGSSKSVNSFAVAFLALAVLTTIATAAAGAELRVMTLNVAGVHPSFAGHPSQRIDKLADFVVAHGIDVIGLQEVTRGTSSLGGADVVDLFAGALRSRGWITERVFALRYRTDGGKLGNAIFSRHPISDHRVHKWGKNLAHSVLVTVEKGQHVRVVNYHPLPHKAWDTIPKLEAAMAEYSGRTVLLGDFNLLAHGLTGLLALGFTDACDYDPTGSCRETVDDAYHGPGWAAVDFVLVRGVTPVVVRGVHGLNVGLDVSDHYAVGAVLTW